MNPETNKFEEVFEKGTSEESVGRVEHISKIIQRVQSQLVRADGSPVPAHWSTFKVGELVEIKGYTFKVCYIGETSILFEPAGATVVMESPTKSSNDGR